MPPYKKRRSIHGTYVFISKDKNKKDPNAKLPRIVGLTASIGIENAEEDEDAVKAILQVCGNLDVDCISTVKNHIEELKQEVPVPEELPPVELQERENNKPVDEIINIMEELENHAKRHAEELKNKDLVALLKKIPSDKKSQQYGQWAVKMRKLAKCLPHRNLIIIADYMMAYNCALETHDLVQLKDVMGYLKKSFDKYPENKRIAGEESTLYDFFLRLEKVVQGQMTEDNPNLEQLKEILKKHLIDREEKSCGIIFVRSRALSQALKSWLENCDDDEIRQLNATVFTGTSASVEQGGMTLKEQKEVITRFRSGNVRLLVATPVGEEGFDIPECNLALKYNHVGNEVTTIQTRGRSRKEGGMSILLGMGEILKKEKQNQEKATLMVEAIKKVCHMQVSDIKNKNNEYQEIILKKKETEERKSKQKPDLKRESFNIVCPLCDDDDDDKKLVIRCEDIRTIQGTHRVVVDGKIWSRVEVIPDNYPSYLREVRIVKCRCQTKAGEPCGNKLGRITIYNKAPFVVLGITSVCFKRSEQRAGIPLESYKQWNIFPYAIDEITEEDFNKYWKVMKEQKDVNHTGEQDFSQGKTDNDNNGGEDKENRPKTEHTKLDQATGFSSPANPNATGQDNATDGHSKSNRPKRDNERSIPAAKSEAEFHREQNRFKVKVTEVLGSNNLSINSDGPLSADNKFQTHSSCPSSQPLQISIDSYSDSMSKRERPAFADTPQRSACNNIEKEEGNEDDTQIKELQEQEQQYENNEVSQINRPPDGQDRHETDSDGQRNLNNSHLFFNCL